jgi:transcription initiation factor TFIID subunit 5
MKNYKPFTDLVKENMLLEIYKGPLRDIRQQTIHLGGMLGESNSNNNTAKIYYGLLKEPELALPEENGEDGDGEGEKPKRRKNRKDALASKKNRLDPNAPQFDRIPLPELRDVDRQNRQQVIKDYSKRARLSADKLPSICFYTILNSYNIVNCCDLSDDSTWLVLGLSDSTIQVCTLAEKKKLELLKPLHDLEGLDKESDDIYNMMFDKRTGVDHMTLIGHSGPIYGVTFSPDKYFVVSGSEDGSVRLWCLLTFSCLVSYKGHTGPVWDVKFSPYGHYFASCGMDKTTRVWSTDQYQALRVYADHLGDIECICFHPNSNYLASGSNDRTIRIYDLANVTDNPQVRQYTGHKSSINVLKFSNCGRYLASAGSDATIYIWDISISVIVAQFCSHKEPIYSLEFSRDNTVLCSGISSSSSFFLS